MAREVGLPLMHALLAHASGDPVAAVRPLYPLRRVAHHFGGSHAQRDLFEQLWIDAMQRAGQDAAVLNLLQPRANAAPASRRLARRVSGAAARLGLPPA